MFDYLKELVQNVRIADIVDIGIIASFIYLVLVWFKKARARFMLIGMFIMGSVYVLARLFGLYLTTAVFQAFLAIFLIVIVIIFQDDFRRFFERVAILGIKRRHRKGLFVKEEINILASALAELSRKRIGALVVLQGRDPLDRYIERSIPLDGLMSQILLESIFDPHVPSHDGAIIIDGRRIVKIGAYLPLSTNVEEVGHLGTRHAAAVGIGEHSDAMAIVVSEEHGTISAAQDGEIKQLKDAAELIKVLEHFYSKRFPVRKRTIILDFLTGHSMEKIAAFILACGLWMAFGYRTEIIRRELTAPIEYRNLAPDVIIEEAKPREVSITLSGSERAFSILEPNELKVSLDASRIKDGENEFRVTKDSIRLPAGITLINIEPEGILLKVYKRVAVTIPVEIKTHGRPPYGVVIREIKAEPKEISAIVPSTFSREKLAIVTEPIELKSITETAVLTPKLIYSPDIRFPGDKLPEVKVLIEIGEKEEDK